MREQQIKQNLQQIIEIATQTTLMLQNQNNKTQQKLTPEKESGNSNPSPPPSKCSVCGVELKNPTHTLCWEHWKEKQEEIENTGGNE